MKTKLTRIAIILTLALTFLGGGENSFVFSQIQSTVLAAKTYELTNDNWFDGTKFKRKVFYSANGFLTEKRPFKVYFLH